MDLKFLLAVFSLAVFVGCTQAPEATPAPVASLEIGPRITSTPSPSVGSTATSAPAVSPTMPASDELSRESFVEACDSMSGEERTGCLQRAAAAYDDYELCDEIESLQETFLCQAAVSGDGLKCERIKDGATKALCYNVVGVNTGDEELCAKIQEEGDYYKRDCFFNVAFQKSDSSICSKEYFLPGSALSEYRSHCEALALRDAGKCGDVSDMFKRDECYATLALALKDKHVCNKIEKSMDRLSCLTAYDIMEGGG